MRRRRTGTFVGSTTLFLSALFASIASSEQQVLTPEEWGQRRQHSQASRRKRRQRQLVEVAQLIEVKQNVPTMVSPQSTTRRDLLFQRVSTRGSFRPDSSQQGAPGRTQQQKQGQQQQQKEQKQQQQQQQQQQEQGPRHPTDLCDRAAELYAAEGGQCTCAYDSVTSEIASLDCHFPTCEECVQVGTSEMCATISTQATVSNLGTSSSTPVEASYTECFTYTKGRFDTMCYTEFLDANGSLFDDCFLNVNGVYCRSCKAQACDGAAQGLSELDCSNVYGGDHWDFCDSGGVFNPPIATDSVFFAFADPQAFSFDTCSRDAVLSWKPMAAAVGSAQTGERDREAEHGSSTGNIDSNSGHHTAAAQPITAHKQRPAPPSYYLPQKKAPQGNKKNNVFAEKKGTKQNVFHGMGKHMKGKTMKSNPKKYNRRK